MFLVKTVFGVFCNAQLAFKEMHLQAVAIRLVWAYQDIFTAPCTGYGNAVLRCNVSVLCYLL